MLCLRQHPLAGHQPLPVGLEGLQEEGVDVGHGLTLAHFVLTLFSYERTTVIGRAARFWNAAGALAMDTRAFPLSLVPTECRGPYRRSRGLLRPSCAAGMGLSPVRERVPLGSAWRAVEAAEIRH